MAGNDLEKELLQEFQWFHRNPELSYEEFETTKHIRELLEKDGITILNLPLETGLVAEVKGELPGPVVAIRCDIDGLPVEEETALPWKSEVSGKMHACGHDFHTTAIWGAARLLQERREHLQGTVKIIFQPAEESSLGALKVIETGVLEDVEAIFGIHVSSVYPVGALGIREGSVTAAVDRFSIEVKGRGTHAAHPQDGIDPIVTAAAIVQNVQSIVSRNVDPLSAGLVSITQIKSGSTWNVIPEYAFLEGTVRTLDKENRSLIPKRLKEIAEYTAKAYGAEAEFHWIPGPPATDNDPFWTGFSREAAEHSGYDVRVDEPSLGGEDFAFYQEIIRGVYIRIGTGETWPNHNPRFEVDPKALKPASEYVAALAEQALKRLKQEEAL